MKSVKFSLIAIVVLMGYICHAAEEQTLQPYDTTNVRGVAGMLLLRTTPMLTNNELRIIRYRELLATTGLSAEELISYLEALRSDPEAGKALYDAMHNELFLKPDTTK